MARQHEELDIDFGLESSPKKVIKFIAFGFGGLAMLGVAVATMVYMTSPVARQGSESSGRWPSLMSVLVGLTTNGKMDAYALDRTMDCAYKSIDLSIKSFESGRGGLEHVSPSKRMQMERDLKEKCSRIGR